MSKDINAFIPCTLFHQRDLSFQQFILLRVSRIILLSWLWIIVFMDYCFVKSHYLKQNILTSIFFNFQHPETNDV